MAQLPIVAWWFRDGDDHDDGAKVVYARTEATARALACKVLEHDPRRRADMPEVERAELLDRHADGVGEAHNLTDEDFLNAGWTVGCLECEHRVSDDGEPCEQCWDNLEDEVDDEGNPLEVPDEGSPEWFSVCAEGGVFCTSRCRDRHNARVERRKVKKAAAVAALLARFPFVRPLGTSVGCPGECQGPDDPARPKPPPRDRRKAIPLDEPYVERPRVTTCFDLDPDNVYVRFKVPGGEVSETTRDGNAYHNVYCFGCKHAWIAKGDYPAFECAAVQPDAVVPSATPSETEGGSGGN